MAEYFINEAEIAAMTDSLIGPVARDLTRRAIRVQNVARVLCPVDHGRLRASITYQIVASPTGLVARIGSNVEYARYVEEGTGIYGPHQTPIVPVNASVLVFTPKGATGPVFARSVKGMKPRPYLVPALPAGLT
jgi:Bacteriophage HK97-gp10, putative tail-component